MPSLLKKALVYPSNGAGTNPATPAEFAVAPTNDSITSSIEALTQASSKESYIKSYLFSICSIMTLDKSLIDNDKAPSVPPAINLDPKYKAPSKALGSAIKYKVSLSLWSKELYCSGVPRLNFT